MVVYTSTTNLHHQAVHQSAPGRTSGQLGFYHDGVGSPAVLHLYGEGKGVGGMATLVDARQCGMDTALS